MIKARFGDRIDGIVHALFPFLFARRLNPNLLSVLGALISVGAAAAFAAGALRAAGLLVLLGGFFDLVDGVVARHQGRATRVGAFLDSTLDRLVDMAVLLGIVMYYARAGELGLVGVAGVALISSVLVSYAKARAEIVLGEVRGGVFERAERIVILALGALTGLLPLALWIVALGAAVTVVQRVAGIHRELARLDAEPRSPLGDHP